MPNRLIRAALGGDWLKIKPEPCCKKQESFWIRPVFPEATKNICHVEDEEKYNHTLFRSQKQIPIIS